MQFYPFRNSVSGSIYLNPSSDIRLYLVRVITTAGDLDDAGLIGAKSFELRFNHFIFQEAIGYLKILEC
jgi:hypothetical protein